MVKESGSGEEGPGFDSWPDHGVMSLGKTFTIYFLLVGLVSVTVTRGNLRKDTCLCPLRETLLSRLKGKNTKYSDVNLEF